MRWLRVESRSTVHHVAAKYQREPPGQPFLSDLPSRKIYKCSPPETTAGVVLSPFGIQRNQPRTKRPPRSTDTAPTRRTANRVCQLTQLHQFGSVHSRRQN
ncbi:hypothetical protein CRG98_022765 [Punica granatum]|uniref:Uncharacterized protein n=1 Tax=Punica granatum TaxID=22663 RepID=A0A2I0JKQ6_PUNGR|nr:hypothetical protein CRG98_022765 [Punica granatum]